MHRFEYSARLQWDILFTVPTDRAGLVIREASLRPGLSEDAELPRQATHPHTGHSEPGPGFRALYGKARATVHKRHDGVALIIIITKPMSKLN